MRIDFFQEDVRKSASIRRRKLESGSVTFTESYKQFGEDYFDNPDLGAGYGRYVYDGRYAEAARRMITHYGLKPGSRILEIGCAKGFLLVEFLKQGMDVTGLDISRYAVEQAHPDLKGRMHQGSASQMLFEDDAFDLVLGKEILPHLSEAELRKAVGECARVSKGNLFFEIQCGTTPAELDCMCRWDVTHQTARTPEWWDSFFAELCYNGDVHYKVLIHQQEGA